MTPDQITTKINEIIEAVEHGYEMDCQISIEFTPAPDFRTPILEFFRDNKLSITEYQNSLDKESSYEFHLLIS